MIGTRARRALLIAALPSLAALAILAASWGALARAETRAFATAGRWLVHSAVTVGASGAQTAAELFVWTDRRKPAPPGKPQPAARRTSAQAAAWQQVACARFW